MEQQEKRPNRIFCPLCSTLLTSTHAHDFKWCNCKDEKKRTAVDGGNHYLRRLGNFDNCIELSVTGDEPTNLDIEKSNPYNSIRNIALGIIYEISRICRASLMIREKINFYSYRNPIASIEEELITFDLFIVGINKSGDKEFFVFLKENNFVVNIYDISRDGERILNKELCINKMFEYNEESLKEILHTLKTYKDFVLL